MILESKEIKNDFNIQLKNKNINENLTDSNNNEDFINKRKL